MSGAKKLTKAEIARQLGVSKAYLSKPKFKGMPDFFSIEEARDWLATHHPPKRSSAKMPVPPLEVKKCDGAENTTSTSGESLGEVPMMDMAEVFQAGVMGDDADEEFETMMLRQNTSVVKMAYGLYGKAVSSGNAAQVAYNLKNYTEAAKQASIVRERYIDTRLKSRAVLPLDESMHILVSVLQELKNRLDKLGRRHGKDANPENPQLATSVIDAAIDEIFKQMEMAPNRAESELRNIPDEALEF